MNNEIDKTMASQEELLSYLKTYMTPERINLIEKNVLLRTRYISVILEDIKNPQNANAIIRTCDGFGIQDVHIVENAHTFDIRSKVTKGADKWLSLHKYDGELAIDKAIKKTRADGYRILATTPHKTSKSIDDVDVSQGKIALLFGTEREGISKRAIELADEFVHIPMVGFTESFNVSTTVAMCLKTLRDKLVREDITWQLSGNEQKELLFNWAKLSVRSAEDLIQYYLSRNSPVNL